CSFFTTALRGVMRHHKMQPIDFTLEYLKEWMIKIGKGRSQRVGMLRRQFAAVLYDIWIERNSRIFRSIVTGPDGIIRKILSFDKL
ncbi:hypothetical protein Dimus_021311, partial [Dionaea muscipula]